MTIVTVSPSSTHSPSTSTVLGTTTVSGAASSTSSGSSNPRKPPLLLTYDPADVVRLVNIGAAAPSIVLSLGNQLAILAAVVGAPMLHIVANVL